MKKDWRERFDLVWEEVMGSKKDFPYEYGGITDFIAAEKERSQREAKLEVLREVRERILRIGRYDIPKSRSVIAVIDQLISELSEEKK